MKTVELRRHSIKTGWGEKDLSPAGIEFALQVGADQLRGQGYTHLFQSPMKRTQQTLALFAEAAGDFPKVAPELFPPHMEVSETKESLAVWSGVCHDAEQKGKDMMRAVLEEAPKQAHQIADNAAASFERWIETIPEGAHVLVVGHSPFFELLALGLYGHVFDQLQACEGIRITKNGEEYQCKRLGIYTRS